MEDMFVKAVCGGEMNTTTGEVQDERQGMGSMGGSHLGLENRKRNDIVADRHNNIE